MTPEKFFILLGLGVSRTSNLSVFHPLLFSGMSDSWRIIYKSGGNPDILRSVLDDVRVEYFLPVQRKARVVDFDVVEKEVDVMNNIMFVKTDNLAILKDIPGVLGPYIDCATKKPATVSDAVMQRFIRILQAQPEEIKLLRDPFSHFIHNKKVVVTDGPFKGMEGYLVRIRRDRKLVISLDHQAVAISGIPFALLREVSTLSP